MVGGRGEAAGVRDVTRAGPCWGVGGRSPMAPAECGGSGRPWTYTKGSSVGVGGSTHLSRVKWGVPTIEKRLGHTGQLVWNGAQSRCPINVFEQNKFGATG